MRNYVIINGVNSLTIKGLAIKTLPPITKPIQRTLREEIDGRDGDIVTTLGYGAYDKTIEIGLFGTFDIDEVIAYFNQKGTITFSNEADKVYYFEALDQVDYAELLKFRTANVVLHCQPFKYPTEETPLVEEYEYVEATGTNVTLDNTSEAIFNKIELQGNTEQEITTGKNLFNNFMNSTQNLGATKTAIPTGVRVTTSSGNQWTGCVFVLFNIRQMAGQTFKARATITPSGSNLGYMALGKADANGNNRSPISATTASGEQTITCVIPTIEAGDTAEYLYIALNGNSTGSVQANAYVNYTDLQLEKATSATPYEPYSGGSPAPRPSFPMPLHIVRGDNSISITTKNLFNDGVEKVSAFPVVNLGKPTYFQNSAYTYSFKKCCYLQAGVEYTFSYKKNTPSSAGNRDSIIVDGNNIELENVQLWRGNVEKRTFTPHHSGWLTLAVDINTTEIQIEIGNQQTEYEAFGEEYPISLGCKNLWDNPTKGWIPTSGAYPTTNSQYPNAEYVILELQEGESLTFSGSTSQNGRIRYINPTTEEVMGAVLAEENAYFISTTSGIASWTEGTLIAKQRVKLAVLDITGGNRDLIINYGITTQRMSDNPIEMLSIPNTNYKDVFVKEGDTWYKREAIGKIKLDNTYYNGRGTTGTNAYYMNINVTTLTDNATALIYSDKFLPSSFNDRANGLDVTYSQNGQVTLRTANNTTYNWTDAQNSKDWLDANTPIICYVKPTTEDIEVVDEILIDQLEAIKNAISYKGQTNITQTNNDLPFVLDLSALKENSDHLVIDNIGNIYSKPTLDLEGTGIVDIYLNDTQMFEVDLSEKNEIVIDTDKMEAYNPTDNTLANRQVTGDYSKFKLESGENDLRFSGDLTKATITKYIRWL